MTHKTLTTAILLSLPLLGYHIPCYSSVYKWTDENGQVHYSDQPKAPGAEKFDVRQHTTTRPRTVAAGTEEDTAENNDATPGKGNKQTDKPVLVEVERSKQQKRQLCNEAKTDITTISSSGRMREVNAKGEYIYLSEQQRQQRLAAARKKQREFCR